MRSKLLTFFVTLIAAFALPMFLQAETDVTATYLTNTDFETAPITYTESNGAVNPNAVAQRKEAYPVTGWTLTEAADYARCFTAAYGITFTTIPTTMNGVIPPSTDKNGNASGNVFMMSGSWGSTVILTQNVTLAGGKYRLEFDVLNQNGTKAIATNRFGFVPNTGTATYGTKTAFANTWTTETVTFTAADAVPGKISIGIIGVSDGAANNGKLAVDNIKLIYLGVDKTDLIAKITTAETLYGAGTGNEAANLLVAIDAAKIVKDNEGATQTDAINAITALDTAIFNYRLANASSGSPVNVTNLLTNPSFEATNRFQGWINPGEFGAQTNAPQFTKDGSVYMEKYIVPPATLGEFTIYQTAAVPNGLYKLTAVAHARVNQNGTNPAFAEGAAIYANDKETIVSTGQDYFVNDISVANGSITIGFKTIAGMANWVGVDNFRLEYMGIDLTAMTTGLQAEVDKAKLIVEKMQTAVKTELAAAIVAAETAIATPEKVVLNAAAVRLAAAVTAAKTSINAYAALKVAIEGAVLPTSAKSAIGYDKFAAALVSANKIYTDANSDTSAVNAAIAALKAAIETVNASLYTIIDVTSLISNPSFEEVQTDKSQTIPGWTKTGATNSEYCTRNDGGPNSGKWKTGNVYFQYWSGSNVDFSISQELTSLPNGKYTLKASAGATGTFIYANDVQTAVTGDAWDANGVVKEYSVDVEVTNNTLTIGYKSVSRTSNWAYADNFRLYYHKPVATTGVALTSFEPNKAYYLYNAGSGKFLSFGGNWATQAIASPKPGTPITLAEATEGSKTYKIQYVNTDPKNQVVGKVSYLRTSDLYADQMDGAATTVGIFSFNKDENEPFFTLTSTDLNANATGKHLAVNTTTHNSTNGRWGVATGSPTYGLNMSADKSDYTQWYLYDAALFDARYNLSKLLKIASNLGLSVSDYIDTYNDAVTVEAVNTAIVALGDEISETASSLDFTSYVDDAGLNDGDWASMSATAGYWKPFKSATNFIETGVYRTVVNGNAIGSYEAFSVPFDFNQVLTGLPKGKYTLKAQISERPGDVSQTAIDAHAAGTEVLKSKLYAASSVAEFSQSPQSLYAHEYENTWGGTKTDAKYTKIYANNMPALQNAFLAGYYEVELNDIMVGEDGKLTIGIKKSDNTPSNTWVMFDNFRLIYEGVDLTALETMLAEKIAAAQECLDNADMGWFNKTELETTIAAGTSVEQSFNAMNAAIAALETSVVNYKAIETRYTPLKNKIAEAEGAIDTEAPGATEYQAAITAAKGVYGNVAEQTAENLQAAIDALTAAGIGYYIAGLATPPSKTTPADLTQFLANPSFETGNTNGWTLAGTSNDTGVKENSNETYKINNADGNYVFNTWSYGYGISQTLAVPNGAYELKVLIAQDASGSLTIFANGATKTITHSADKATGVDATISVNVIDGYLSLGTKNGDNWYKVDNFRLYYAGDVPVPTLQVDKAKFDFFPFSKEQSFVVSGTNLTSNVTLTPPAGITLSKTSVTPAEAAAEGGATVTATLTGTEIITGKTIAIATGFESLDKSIAVNGFPQIGDNLIQYWNGLGAEAVGTKPNNVGWSNTTGNTIPWADANSSGGCRFRDNTADITFESNGEAFTGRHLMLRWDNDNYYSSVYAYPVVLEAAKDYKFNFDVFLGGSATGEGAVNVGISTTPDETGRLSSEIASYTTGSKVNIAPTYEFKSEGAGLYYITIKGNDYTTSYRPWIGIANLSLVKYTKVAIESTSVASGKLSVYPTVTSNLLTVNKEEGTKITIYSISGNKVMETTLSNPLNVGFLESGIYLIGTENGEKAKFIKK